MNYIYGGTENDGLKLQRKYDNYLKIKKASEKQVYQGVYWDKSRKKWEVKTSSAKGLKQKNLGRFDTKEEGLKVLDEYYKLHSRNYLSNYK